MYVTTWKTILQIGSRKWSMFLLIFKNSTDTFNEWQAFDLKISWSHTHNNHHIFGRGIWEKEIVSAKCHTKQLWVYMYVSIQQYKRIGMWAAVIWIDEDMKNLESTLLATSLYIWLPNQHTGLNERTKKTILFIANQLIRVAAESKSCDVTQWKFIFVAGQKLKKQSFEVRSLNHSGIFFICRWSLNHCAPPLAWQVSTGSKWFRDHLQIKKSHNDLRIGLQNFVYFIM